MRQSENWADAFASVDEDEDDPADEYPVFSDSARLENTYGFHLYQELDRHLKSFITSIPFHDECWTLLDLAIEETGNEKNLDRMNEKLELDHMWGGYFRSLITVSDQKQQVEQTRAILQAGKRKEVTTRFGEVDYRQAQSSAEGWHWKHEDACHVGLPIHNLH